MQADIGAGFFIAILLSSLFNVDPTIWFILFCVGASLLPDIDFLIEFAIHHDIAGTEIREHRELLHFPASYILLIVLVFILGGPVWGWAAFLGIFWHFLHDSIGIGFGITWLWPVSTRNYKFFSGKNGYISWNFLQMWKKSEMADLAHDWGIDGWVTKIYLKPFPIRVPIWLLWVTVVEWAIFLIACFALYAYLTSI